jgi:hypothetical protein
MDIGSNFEWTWVNWIRNNFPKMESNDFGKASMEIWFPT